MTRKPSSPADRVLCRLDAIPVGGAIGIDSPDPGEPGWILFREASRVHAYRNDCPHANLPLDLIPGRFLSRDRRFLLCANHGAQFVPESGKCVAGPCRGRTLTRVRVTVQGDDVVLTDPVRDPS